MVIILHDLQQVDNIGAVQNLHNKSRSCGWRSLEGMKSLGQFNRSLSSKHFLARAKSSTCVLQSFLCKKHTGNYSEVSIQNVWSLISKKRCVSFRRSHHSGGCESAPWRRYLRSLWPNWASDKDWGHGTILIQLSRKWCRWYRWYVSDISLQETWSGNLSGLPMQVGKHYHI